MGKGEKNFGADLKGCCWHRKDASVCVWDTATRPPTLVFHDYLDYLNWQSAIHCQFNPNGSRLMISGLLASLGGNKSNGEIVVYQISDHPDGTSGKKKFRICSRISNKPFDRIVLP